LTTKTVTTTMMMTVKNDGTVTAMMTTNENVGLLKVLTAIGGGKMHSWIDMVARQLAVRVADVGELLRLGKVRGDRRRLLDVVAGKGRRPDVVMLGRYSMLHVRSCLPVGGWTDTDERRRRVRR